MPQTFAELKASSPAYAQMSDLEFASKLYRKHYADKMDFPTFAGKVGFDPYGDSNPTEGMSAFQKLMAGRGKSLYDTGRGIKQLVQDAMSSGTDLLGMIGGQANPAAKRKAAVDQQRKLDAPLMNDPWGLAGNIEGTAEQVLVPGGLASMALKTPRVMAAVPQAEGALRAIQSASMPDTIKGNAVQGGLLGAIQPRGTDDSLARNVVVSGLLSAGTAAATRLPSMIGSGARKLMPAYNEALQTKAAGRVLNEMAADPAAVRAAAANPQMIVPGSMPTLAEASGDVGLAGLQRTLANTPEFGNALSARQQANNLARVRHIEGAFGGADSAGADALRATRDQAASRVLRPMDEIPLDTVGKVSNAVGEIAKKRPANMELQDAMASVQDRLSKVRTVADAHDVRQYIGQLMGGKVEGKAGAKYAQRELGAVRTMLDREMRGAYPDWSKFLMTYKTLSREADQMDVGQALLDTGRAVRGATNEPVLTPAAFSRAAGNMDRTVQRATGFAKASAARTLTEPQAATVDAVRRDLERYSRAMLDGKAVGSNTMQNAIGGNRLQDAVGPVGATMIEPASGVAMLAINQARKVYGERVGALVQEAMLDPARAAEILARVPDKARPRVLELAGPALARLTAASGALVIPVASRTQDAPTEAAQP